MELIVENVFENFKPIYNFFVPYGWQVDKNNLFDINVEEFFLKKNESIGFEIRDKFFCQDVFWAKKIIEIKNISLIAMVSIGCRLEIFSDSAIDSYDIDLTIMKGKSKNKKYFFQYETISGNRKESAKIASDLMYAFSHILCERIADQTISLTESDEIEKALLIGKGKGKFLF